MQYYIFQNSVMVTNCGKTVTYHRSDSRYAEVLKAIDTNNLNAIPVLITGDTGAADRIKNLLTKKLK